MRYASIQFVFLALKNEGRSDSIFPGDYLIWDPTAHRRTPLLSFAAARWLFAAILDLLPNFGDRKKQGFALAEFAPEDTRRARHAPQWWPSVCRAVQEAKHKVCEIVDLLISKVTNRREAFFLAQTLTKSPSVLLRQARNVRRFSDADARLNPSTAA